MILWPSDLLNFRTISEDSEVNYGPKIINGEIVSNVDNILLRTKTPLSLFKGKNLSKNKVGISFPTSSGNS